MAYVGMAIGALLLGLLGFATWKRPRLMGTVLWSFFSMVLMSAALIILLPGDLFNRMIIITFLSPLFWVGLMFWCYYGKHQWRSVGAMLVMTMVGLGVVLASGPVA